MFYRILLYLVGLATALLIWGFGIEPGLIVYRDQDIHLKGWPKELSGFTIALMSDTHVGSPHITLSHFADIVEGTNARKPDMVLLAGDYVIQGVLGGHPVPSKDIIAVMAKLKSVHGTYAILGNHDHWDDAKRMTREFETAGIPVMDERARYMDINGAGFWLMGISDYMTTEHDFRKPLSTITDDKPIIALTHSPDVFPDLPDRVSLLLAGHTHGGQVWIPFMGRPVIPSKYGQRYAIGLVREGEKQLFVTSGIGTSNLPVRFMTPPEVVFLHIYPQ